MQSKLESLIDKHMSSLSASKLSLSSLTTETLWRQSGRYSSNSELLRVADRKESGFLLSPTHEEEITALVANMVHSYKDLPLRLYQIGRKYRDERRPRQGLLRAKEFVMKDLYTFDVSADAALATYEQVRRAYNNMFDELKIPYLVADADSGNMGGKLSHEYHFVSPKGEDNVWSCNGCEYVANEELVEKRPAALTEERGNTDAVVFTGISTDHKTAIHIHIPRPASLLPNHNDTNASHQTSTPTHLPWTQISTHVNLHAVKRALPSHLTLATGIESSTLSALLPSTTSTFTLHDAALTTSNPTTPHIDLTPILPSSPCPRCPNGTLHPHRAIELAHTFHLGTRYSDPLGAAVARPNEPGMHALHMGCHGIGVTRLVGAVAGLLCDERGLNWPRGLAPWEVVVLVAGGEEEGRAVGERVYDVLGGGEGEGRDGHVDAVLDDRVGKSLGWKLRDAELIGYPVVVVVGRGWRERSVVEVQCRRLGVKRDVGLGEVRSVVAELLARL